MYAAEHMHTHAINFNVRMEIQILTKLKVAREILT